MSSQVKHTDLCNELAVSVAPTPTTLYAALNVEGKDSVCGYVYNNDSGQEVALTAITTFNGTLYPSPIYVPEFVETIPPLGSRFFTITCDTLKWLTIRGAASGAGCTLTVSLYFGAQRIHR